MPPKRRKNVEPDVESEPAPKRRSTRLSAKVPINAQTETRLHASESSPVPSKDATSTPKEPKKLKQNTTSKSKPKTKSKPQDSTSPKPTTTTTSSTFTHPSLKSPIPYATYPSPSQSKPISNNKTLIFTHGAGGTISAPALVNFCTAYSTLHPVLAFQGSMNLGARVKGFRACIEHLQELEKGKKQRGLVLGGRSMGARGAVIAASEYLGDVSKDEKKDGDVEIDLILASYPLQGPKDVRDKILLDLSATVRVLFVVGDRDSMCPLDLLRDVRGRMEAKSWLIVVKGADHGMSKKETCEMAGRKAAEWVGGDRWDTGKDVEVE